MQFQEARRVAFRHLDVNWHWSKTVAWQEGRVIRRMRFGSFHIRDDIGFSMTTGIP